MSQAHIPQPGTGGSPGEQIVSTDTVLPLTSIEVPKPSPVEIDIALGEFNAIDPYFYNQFREIAKIRWTVQDVPGKCLWYIPLNPLAMDKNLAYLAKMYLAWSGDFVFNIKVAGTGFHAGMITFIKTPPNVHPEQISSPQDFSIFPWVAIDPKTLELSSVLGRDIRPIKFHYTQKSEKMPDDYYVGGWLSAFVDIPLNTSASGTPRIDIAVWVCCQPSFKFGWIVPFDLQTVQSYSIPPPGIDEVLNQQSALNAVASCYPIPVDSCLILPKTVKVLNNGLYNCFNVDQKTLSQLDPKSGDKFASALLPYVGLVSEIGEKGTVLKDVAPFWQGLPQNELALHSAETSYAAVTKLSKLEAGAIVHCTHIDGGASGNVPGLNTKMGLYTATTKIKPSNLTDKEYAAKTGNESFFVFGSGDEGFYSAQYTQLSEALANGRFKDWIPEHSCAVFQLVEINTHLPITYLKFYRDGFFTAPAQENQIQLVFGSFKMKFQFFIPETEEIPVNAIKDTTNNLRLASMVHGKAITRYYRQRY